MEAGRLDDIPGRVYARGFVRSYARLLDVDVEDLLAKLPPDENELPPGETVPVNLKHAPLKRRRSYGWIWLLVAALLVAAYVYYGHRHRGASSSAPPGPASVQKQKKSSSAPSVASSTSSTPSSATSAATAPTSPPPQAKLVSQQGKTMTYQTLSGADPAVSFTITGKCWFSVRVDGTLVKQGEPSSGSFQYTGHHEIVVVVGWPAHMNIQVLGRQVPLAKNTLYVIVKKG